ncbi:allene oxide synthase [Prunus dulcis]|uniref:Allene oxide synthase n=1 Tax=Prunus dulcis TaxID=3755 RepID=A0A4Y1R7I6_PRUDU|nr:allene oxide synthase [Prunus dulcis]
MSFMMSMTPGIPSSSSSSSSSSSPSPPFITTALFTASITSGPYDPGAYGWPLLGPISDRLDYFWFQGPETFFKKRTEKYKSTVFRTNVPPSFPLFLNVNPNVVVLFWTASPFVPLRHGLGREEEYSCW